MRRKRGRRGRTASSPLSAQAQETLAQARTAIDRAIRQRLEELENERREILERCSHELPLEPTEPDGQPNKESNDGRR